jgi:hypothetical protein
VLGRRHQRPSAERRRGPTTSIRYLAAIRANSSGSGALAGGAGSPGTTRGATSAKDCSAPAGKKLVPGDEPLEEADGVATRAITIDAPASAVWPWIAQMGPSPRGGAYTYDWIENRLGLDMHSTDRVLPDYQHPRVGDILGYGKNRMRFELVEPQRVLATRSEDGNWVWSFVLEEHD